MCIICTRCVRACDEIRHTGAITLAGRGSTTRIAFGAGGPVHESNCDFCGACIDVCPTATLMEHPNKWSATQTERWTPTTCMQCSVGCSIFLGTKKGRGVIVRPDAMSNPVSKDQLCVRGRFHYDAVKNTRRIQAPLIKRNGGQDTATWDEALEFTAARIAQVREQHGTAAIGFLGSPMATNEENYLLGKIARAIVGTNNVDSSVATVTRASAESQRAAFGSEVLPADMTRLAASKTILVVADDLESSHNVAALRIKDAAIRGKARVVVISSLWNELNDFAEVWIQPKPGEEAAIVAALAAAVEHAKGIPSGEKPSAPEALIDPLAKATEVLAAGAGPVSLVYGLPHFGPNQAGAVVAALANIAIAVAGEEAAQALFVLPQEANVIGMRDVGATADLLPGHRPARDDASRAEMQRLWGAQLPAAAGLTFEEMRANGNIKALVVMNDNPLMLAPDQARTRKWLESLEFLAVIDSLATDTANLAHAVFPDTGAWAKDGTTTSTDRRVLRLNQTSPYGESRQGWRVLSELGTRLAERFQPGEIRINYQSAAEIMDEIAQVVPLYANATYREMDPGAQQDIGTLGPRKSERQPVEVLVGAANGNGFALRTGRSLYTSYEAAAVHDADADLLHREDSIKMNPADAASLGVSEGDVVLVRNGRGEIRVKAGVTEAVQPRTVYLPLYYDGGAVTALFEADAAVATVEVSRG
ncbi:MAG TPA: molybdopterin-dependent oxidoreductase [Dehalococcoidia bacterium]|nr:molybdopterin-dependent oxidoreductase [Dehalococcoidia bacterium]